MKSTITTPDELTTLRIEGSSGTYKIFSSFRPMESPAFVDAVDRKYNLAEIKNLSLSDAEERLPVRYKEPGGHYAFT